MIFQTLYEPGRLPWTKGMDTHFWEFHGTQRLQRVESTFLFGARTEYERDEEGDIVDALNKYFAACAVEPSPVTSRFLRQAKEEGSFIFDLTDKVQPWQEEVARIHRRLDAFASWAFSSLRWRFGVPSGPLRLESHLFALRWSDSDTLEGATEGRVGRRIPQTGHVLEFPERTDSQATTESSCEAVLGQGGSAIDNLPHDLWQEARIARHASPRTAYVLAVFAVETGIKRCVADLMPDTRWLLERGPTPPVLAILNDYIPQCGVRCSFQGRVPKLPRPIPRVLNDAFQKRNRLAHFGSVPSIGPDEGVASDASVEEVVSDAEVDELLSAVRDVLYLLDYYRGYAWALDHLRAATREALEREP